MQKARVTVVGAGMAGVEATWALAERGVRVRLVEMKPHHHTGAQRSDHFAEMVCSNSLRSANPANAVGLLKEEMACMGSLVMAHAARHRVPAGDALAVDREHFSAAITRAVAGHPNVEVVCQRVTALPGAEDGPVILATGPLTDPALAAAIAQVTGDAGLYFYDAIAPIVAGDSIDRTQTFAASRWGHGGDEDYLNCPLDRNGYEAFVTALLAAEVMAARPFEEARFFSACLPVEEVAARGAMALRFGCMKAAGLTDPRSGRWPFAVVQLRREDCHGHGYNLVGFQTRLKHPEQRRLFATLPGLAGARWLRLGGMHRNTYLDAPRLCGPSMRLHAAPHLRIAGQICGVEGYLESAAHGLLTGLQVAAELAGTTLVAPPASCAMGALHHHTRGTFRLPKRRHEPHNVNWSMMPPPAEPVAKRDAKAARLARARADFAAWWGAGAAAAPHAQAG